MLTHSAYKSRRGIHLTGETAQNQHNTSRRTTVYPINGFRFLKLLYSLRCNENRLERPRGVKPALKNLGREGLRDNRQGTSCT